MASSEVTARFLQGFRELCDQGLLIHHIHRDFLLSPIGWQWARQIDHDEVGALLKQATDFGFHD